MDLQLASCLVLLSVDSKPGNSNKTATSPWLDPYNVYVVLQQYNPRPFITTAIWCWWIPNNPWQHSFQIKAALIFDNQFVIVSQIARFGCPTWCPPELSHSCVDATLWRSVQQTFSGLSLSRIVITIGYWIMGTSTWIKHLYYGTF